MPDTLSIAIVALNEEANLGRVLESVRWADEIVVVDSGSTDRTCDIAREYGARVIHEPWRGYTAQKNYALELCTKDWILSLDADEEVSPELANEIKQVLASSGPLDGYAIPRKNLFLGRWMKHGGFYPDPKLRLFRRGMAYSTGRDPHDRFDMKESKRVGRTRGAMMHAHSLSRAHESILERVEPGAGREGPAFQHQCDCAAAIRHLHLQLFHPPRIS
jgi:glycosyltransferase involved in cell wall biosynthesis